MVHKLTVYPTNHGQEPSFFQSLSTGSSTTNNPPNTQPNNQGGSQDIFEGEGLGQALGRQERKRGGDYTCFEPPCPLGTALLGRLMLHAVSYPA